MKSLDTIKIPKPAFWKAYELFVTENKLKGDQQDTDLHEIFDRSLGLRYLDDMNDIHSDEYVLSVEDQNKLMLSKIKYGL